jgi:hypothetical protein
MGRTQSVRRRHEPSLKFGKEGGEMRILAAVLFLLAPPVALAQKPTITLLPNPGAVLAPTEPFCGFDAVDRTEPGKPYKEFLVQFANGGALIGGPLFVQSENLVTGQVIDINSSGPAPSITFEPDGSVVEIATGPSLWNIPPPPLAVTDAAGLPPVPYIQGRVTVVFDSSGNITSMKLTGGHAVSFCSLFN